MFMSRDSRLEEKKRRKRGWKRCCRLVIFIQTHAHEPLDSQKSHQAISERYIANACGLHDCIHKSTGPADPPLSMQQSMCSSCTPPDACSSR